MLNNILNNNFAIDNTLEEYELKTATNADDVILNEGHDLDKIIGTNEHKLGYTVYKLDINLDYS